MTATDICITTIISLLSVAFPILLQVISTLDEKYASVLLVELFDKEKAKKGFIYSLMVSIVSVVIFLLQLPRKIDVGVLNWIIENSATGLLYSATIVLVIYFFLFVLRILKYLAPMTLVAVLIRRHGNDRYRDQNNFIYFRVIMEILFYAIRKQNSIIAETIIRFLYGAFRSFRETSSGEPVEYPEAYYRATHDIIGEVAEGYNKRLEFVAFSAARHVLLTGELKISVVSETTFKWMWDNIRLSLRFNKDDFVMEHWENADQIAFQLRQSAEQRTKFLEFHHAVGALALHEKRYALLHRFFSFTRSQPAQYELLPRMMGEIFYFYFGSINSMRVKWLSLSYPFPGWEGVQADDRIEQAIRQYLALLFVRQFTLPSEYIHMDPTAMPGIPDTQAEKKKWIDYMDMFAEQVEIILSNKILLETLEFDIPGEFEPKKKGMVHPLVFIQILKKRLERNFKETLFKQEVSAKKVELFEQTTLQLVLPSIKSTLAINNPDVGTADTKKNFVNGMLQIFDKSAFAEEQDAEHINFHSVLGKGLADKIPRAVIKSFVAAATKNYLLQPQDLASALEKMKLDDSHIILPCYSGWKFERTTPTVIHFTQGNYELPDDSIFVLKKMDLPNLQFLDTKNEWIKKYELKQLNKPYFIYASVVDLNNSDVREELLKDRNEDELRQSVLASIFINLEINWKTNSRVVHIEVFSPYGRKGIPQSLKDVEPFE